MDFNYFRLAFGTTGRSDSLTFVLYVIGDSDKSNSAGINRSQRAVLVPLEAVQEDEAQPSAEEIVARIES